MTDYGALWEAREEALHNGDAAGPEPTTPSRELMDKLKDEYGPDIPDEALGAAIEKIAPPPASNPIREQDRRMARSGTQGKCRRCKECYRWHSRRPLRMAYCPQCGEKLEGTTYSNHWPWNIGVEPLTAVQAWAKFKKG